MSEILEKYLVISFGVMTLFLVIPIFAPLLENSIIDYQERETELNFIDSDMENLRNILNYYSTVKSDENYSKEFEFKSKISCVIYNMGVNSTVYRFCFYRETTKSPIYREIEIDNKFDVAIESIFVSHYLLQNENISKFLTFF